jgi:DNA-nicking Smr family endonuclease
MEADLSPMPVEAPPEPPGSPESQREKAAPGMTAMDKILAQKGVTPARKDVPAGPADLTHGTTPGVDRRQSDRVRKGRAVIGARIDLHGMGRDEAHSALIDFIIRAHAGGHRTVLVITGKGRFSRIQDDPSREPHAPRRGLLQTMVPRWLNDAPLRQRIIGFHSAQPRHGGTGAIYVMLKRHDR